MLRLALLAGSVAAFSALGFVAGRPASPPTPLPLAPPPLAPVPVADGKEALRALLERAFDVAQGEALPAPGPTDWLAHHPEPGQSFEEWLACRRHPPTARRRTLYVATLPGGPPPATGDLPALPDLVAYAEVFFGLPAKGVALAPPRAPYTERWNPHTRHRQLLTTDVLDHLVGEVPSDAFCVLALTATDLYPDPSWSFVFGQATLSQRVGVFSLARYEPGFHGVARDARTKALVLRRALKVMAHELGHMFGIEHCTRFRCLMNGSNHLAETDASPLDVCPVCLRKLRYAARFDVVARERALESWRRAHCLGPEADACAARVARWTASR